MLLLIFSLSAVKANQIKGVEMYTTHLSGKTYTLDITVYQKLSAAANVSVLLSWGHGTTDTLTLFGGIDLPAQDVRVYQYSAAHTFPSDGNYEINAYVHNWTSGIVNMVDAVNQEVNAKCKVIISPFLGHNNFSQYNFNALSGTFTGANYEFNLSVTEGDGDSIVIEQQMVSLLSSAIYTYPMSTGGTEYFTGNVYHFDGMPTTGPYAVSFITKEFRSGMLIASHTREFVFENATSTGMEDLNTKQEISVFPNPTISFITINTATTYPAFIYNAFGKEVMQVNTNTQVDVAKLIRGIYFVRTSTGQVTKLVKQ